MMKEYRRLEGTVRVNSLGLELARVLDGAARDARHDFQAAIEVRPAENPILNHLGSEVHWVDYTILLDDVYARHKTHGIQPSQAKSERR